MKQENKSNYGKKQHLNFGTSTQAFSDGSLLCIHHFKFKFCSHTFCLSSRLICTQALTTQKIKKKSASVVCSGNTLFILFFLLDASRYNQKPWYKHSISFLQLCMYSFHHSLSGQCWRNQENHKGNLKKLYFLLRLLKSIGTFNICSDLLFFFLQVQAKLNPTVQQKFISDLPLSVIKSQSETVWSNLWGEGGKGSSETVTYHKLQLSLFSCQLLSGSETCSKGELQFPHQASP